MKHGVFRLHCSRPPTHD